MAHREIEIHDSKLESIATDSANVVLYGSAHSHPSEGRPGLDPGTGWRQHAVIRPQGEVVSGSLSKLPCSLSCDFLALKENARRMHSRFRSTPGKTLNSTLFQNTRSPLHGDEMALE
jgi:hypothetical protein